MRYPTRALRKARTYKLSADKTEQGSWLKYGTMSQNFF